jgi:hypothetical protein
VKPRLVPSLVVGAVGVLLAAGLATPAYAQAAKNTPSVALQSLLDMYPGSVAVAPDTIRIAPGILLSLPAGYPADKPVPAVDSSKSSAAASFSGGGTVSPMSAWSCSYLYLCLYSEDGGLGYRLSLYYCGFVDLGTINFPGGGKWNDKASSAYNHQSPNATSYFYNWDGVYRWVQVGSLQPGWIESFVVAGINDIIDGVHVC